MVSLSRGRATSRLGHQDGQTPRGGAIREEPLHQSPQDSTEHACAQKFCFSTKADVGPFACRPRHRSRSLWPADARAAGPRADGPPRIGGRGLAIVRGSSPDRYIPLFAKGTIGRSRRPAFVRCPFRTSRRWSSGQECDRRGTHLGNDVPTRVRYRRKGRKFPLRSIR